MGKVRIYTDDDSLNFGYYKGRQLKEIPAIYKLWLIEICTDLPLGLWEYLRKEEKAIRAEVKKAAK